MAKPLDEQTDEELETALAQGQLDERKAAIAKEILSRRWESKSEKIKGRYGWLGHVAAAVALALVAIRRLLRRTERAALHRCQGSGETTDRWLPHSYPG